MSDIIPIEGLNSLIDLFVNEKQKNKNIIENNLNGTQEPNIKRENQEIPYENYYINDLLELEEDGELDIENDFENRNFNENNNGNLIGNVNESIVEIFTGESSEKLNLNSNLQEMSENKESKGKEEEEEVEADNLYERIIKNKLKDEAKQKASKRKRGHNTNTDLKKIKKEVDKKGKDNEVSDKSETKEKRKKVSVACILCRRSHLSCDNKRPCSRCIAKGVPNLCKDAPRKLTNPLKCTACPIFPDLTPAELQRKIHKMYELQKQQNDIVNHLTNSKTVPPELIEQISDINSANLLHYANNMASPNNLGNFLKTSADDINIEYDTNLYPIPKEQTPAIEDIGK